MFNYIYIDMSNDTIKKKVTFDDTITVYYYPPEYSSPPKQKYEEHPLVEAITSCLLGFVFIGGTKLIFPN